MMNSNMKRNRGGRTNTGGRNDKRTMFNQDRPAGVRQRTTPDKNTPIIYDGVYKNTRYTHVIYSLVGSNVQVQVKNGSVYEGVLKTFSPKGDVVLEMAHLVDDNCNSSNSVSSAPSRDRLMDKLIIKQSDVIMVNVTNVDLDYAVKDSFTDAGISKYNGEVTEKNMKELEPWVGEGEIDLGGLDSERANGWDPNDMFKCNAENFNVKSSYDDSLAQYTTPLQKKDTEEYKRREEQASKLAAEIEDTAQYKKHIALENGDGDLDEETRFSAVVRTSETNSQSAPFVQSSGGPGKYVPPNRRNGPGNVMPRARGAYHQSMGRTPPGHPPTPPTSQQQQQQQPPLSLLQQQPAPPSQQHGQSPVQPPPPSSRLEASNVNGEEPAPLPTSTASPTVKVASPVSPVSEQPSSKTVENKPDTSHNPTSPGANKPLDNRKTGKGREELIEEFKQFSGTIKLDPKKDKDKLVTENKEQENTIERERRLEAPQKSEEPHSQEPQQRVEPELQSPQSPQKTEMLSPSDTNRQLEEPKKLTLNPLAKEFVPKPSQPKQSAPSQVPTPPHPQTQSPIAIPQQPMMNIPGPMITPQGFIMQNPAAGMFLNSMAPTVQPQQTQIPRTAKRAVVSVKPDNTAAAVQAATGQPLLAQSAPQNFVYMQQMVPQPQGYHPQMGQVMPMPSANPRYMTPTSGSVPGMPPTSHPGSVEPNNQTHTGQAGPMFMQTQQGGPVPAHMSHPHPSQFSHQPHIPPQPHPQMSNPPTQQNTQMNPQSHHPPAPSPVHTTGPTPQQPINQGHPPSSGTPQPPQGYPQATLQPHPPTHPSPHPTSPQSIQPLHFPYNTSHNHHMQMQGGPQFSMTPHSSVPSSVTYSMQTQGHHSPHMHQPQIVMMPPHPNPTGQMTHPHIHGSQFQGHPMAGPGSVHGQAQMIPQAGMGVQGLTGANSQGASHPPTQMQQYLPQVHSQSVQPVPSYPQSQ